MEIDNMRILKLSLLTVLALVIMSACSPQETASAVGGADNSSQPEPVCTSCGVIRAVNPVTQQGDSSGAGAVIGAIVGGVAGNQVGGGSGRDIATAAGAVGGAFVGNTIERNRGSSTYYEVVIDMETGGQQVINVPDATGISAGVPVRVQNGNIAIR
ncbi:hypothetical protein PHACT_05000 [Pseudohongiella acticola]|jgi:uncharacterized protein YcfJ|uniref:Glycine zipper 2TM domain-containing protein n=2 Tax=Pseudohongiella acticola TaxID=1524254 RepID=A0A1E8CJU4_9GAMM|nr:hypothetical protein PHACT_05000 [Pseudohongiella acticola]